MDVYRTLRIIRRRAWMMIAFPLVGAVLAAVLTSHMPRVYETGAQILIRPAVVAGNMSVYLSNDQVAGNYGSLMASPLVMEDVSRHLVEQGFPRLDPGTLGGMIRVATIPNTTVMVITARGTEPVLLAAIVNQTVTDFLATENTMQAAQTKDLVDKWVSQIQQVDAKIAAEQAELDTLSAQRNLSADQQTQLKVVRSNLTADQQQEATLTRNLADVRSQTQQTSDTLLPLVRAAVPGAPVSPNLSRNVLAAVAAGLVLAFAITFLLEYLDQTIKSDEELTERTGVVPLAHIPFFRAAARPRGELAALDPNSMVAEAYRTLRTSVVLASMDRPLRTIVISSPLAHEGKSRTAANLAVALAVAGHETVVVDADFRRSSMHKIFGQRSRAGLSQLVGSELDPQAEIGVPVDGVPNLTLVTTGPRPDNPSELLGSEAMKELLAQLRYRFRYVVLDTPPLNAVTDASILAAETDGTMLVIEQGRTTYTDMLSTTQVLERAQAQILGAVVNKLRPRDGAYKSYYYPYSYSSGPDASEAEEAPVRDHDLSWPAGPRRS